MSQRPTRAPSMAGRLWDDAGTDCQRDHAGRAQRLGRPIFADSYITKDEDIVITRRALAKPIVTRYLSSISQ
jgi:hypothetical protein